MTCSIDWLQSFYEWYLSFFVYLNIILCAIGVVTNSVNLIVFTRKRMRSSTGVVIAAIAVADVGTSATYARMAWYAYLYRPGYPTEEVYTHRAAIERLVCRHLYILFCDISIWLQVILAIWRYLAVFYPFKCRALCSINRTCWIVVCCYLSSIVLFIPRFVSKVDLLEATDKNSSSWPINNKLYRLKYHDDFMRALHYMIQSCVFQLIPCVALFVFTVSLVYGLIRSVENRQLMTKGNGSAKYYNGTDKTTKMLTILLASFLAIEVLVGVVSFMRMFRGSDCYVYIIHFADSLRLANISVKFCVYYLMSGQYKATLKSLFRNLLSCFYKKEDEFNQQEMTTTCAETISL